MSSTYSTRLRTEILFQALAAPTLTGKRPVILDVPVQLPDCHYFFLPVPLTANYQLGLKKQYPAFA